jgi:hypothetical protein
MAEWRIATEMLMMTAEGKAPTMFAHIGMLKALHAGMPEPPPGPRSMKQAKTRNTRASDERPILL